ncbi:MAG TPA: PD-(D/E)XK nuclease family protein, partial [Phototrophicaceae bacterium]|nr:PD-(D/E)XK nuclease family protein [Phototrophicaceae bacterium]
MDERESHLPDDFQFSQSSLQDYVDCRRRFELRYIQQLKYPAVEAEPVAEHERHMELGDEFHRLIHQHQSGVPEALLTATIHDEMLQKWWNRYLEYGLKGIDGQRYTEVTLSTSISQFRLIAKYDLLAIDPGRRLVIIDWKTSLNQPSSERMLRRLQTIVYRYVLAEAGQILNEGQAVAPEQIEMMYWFTEYPQHPVKIEYDSQEHREAGEYLRDLIEDIKGRSTFELTDDISHCKFCIYRSLCRRGREAGHWTDEAQDGEIDDTGNLP